MTVGPPIRYDNGSNEVQREIPAVRLDRLQAYLSTVPLVRDGTPINEENITPGLPASLRPRRPASDYHRSTPHR